MNVHMTYVFLLMSFMRTQARNDYEEAASAWSSRLDTKMAGYCNVPSKQDWNMLPSSNKHGETAPTLDLSTVSLEKLFHISSYQIPEVIENFSVLKAISGCTCAVKDETALCNELHMNQIPSCVGNTTLAVILISRKISGINGKTFRYTPNLEYLNITGVDLRLKLPGDVFSGFNKLKHLAVQDHGSMPELPEDVFKGLRMLESLYLYNNGFQFLPPNIFASLARLRLLNLADNHLRRLPTGIFDKTMELRELILSGNHFKGPPSSPLLRHNAELRVLLMKDTHLSEINLDLLGNATKLRWLDLSDNYLRQLPADALKICQKLNQLSITGNRFEKLDTQLLLQHNTGLQRLDLRGNEWNCNCDIIPLAGWSLVPEKMMTGRPVCQQPPAVVGISLQEWFCTYGNACTTSDLQKDLGEFIGLTEAIADNYSFSKPANISHLSSNCFFFGMSPKLGSSIELILGRFIHLLENVYQRKYGKTTDSNRQSPQIDSAILARQEPTLKFSYIFQTIPENLLDAVNAGLQAEIISIFDSVNAEETVDGMAASNSSIVAGLREEFRRIFYIFQTCSFPSVIRTEMEAASQSSQSSSAIRLLNMCFYSYLALIIIALAEWKICSILLGDHRGIVALHFRSSRTVQ